MAVQSLTYMDRYIQDANKAVVSLKNLYDTVLTRDADKPDHIIRIPTNDFFLKYRDQLSRSIQYYSILDRHHYQPKTFSYELYGTTELWLSLLRLNNMRNITEFNVPIIKVYNPTDLFALINIFFKREKKKT